jgi:hypothetical protein
VSANLFYLFHLFLSFLPVDIVVASLPVIVTCPMTDSQSSLPPTVLATPCRSVEVAFHLFAFVMRSRRSAEEEEVDVSSIPGNT